MVLLDIEMPNSCDFCPARKGFKDGDYCQLIKSSKGYYGHKILTHNVHYNRDKECPLRSLDELKKLIHDKQFPKDIKDTEIIQKSWNEALNDVIKIIDNL